MNKTVDQIYVDNLYAEITKLTRRAVEAETLLEFERTQRATHSAPEPEPEPEPEHVVVEEEPEEA